MTRAVAAGRRRARKSPAGATGSFPAPVGGIRHGLLRAAGRGRAWLHTPGHQGKATALAGWLALGYDLTEVEDLGPDNIRRAERAVARLFGSRRTWLSTQGATLPVLAAVMAAAAGRPWIWADRGSHRSVYAGLALSRTTPRWLPAQTGPGRLPLPTRWPRGAEAAILTRPTYDGLAWPPPARGGRRGPWVVDEAHGTHWNRAPGYPTPALAAGADLVCQGAHKTEPALTQTGLLHLGGHRLSPRAVDQWWQLLATSSPSYLLLASLEHAAMERAQATAAADWERLARQAPALWERLEAAGYFVLQAWWRRQGGEADPAKLTLVGLRAPEQVRRLGIEPEKLSGEAVTLVLTPATDLDWLWDRLRQLPPSRAVVEAPAPWPSPSVALPPWEALKAPGRWVELEQAVGRVARGWVVPYPPGIPLLAPGDRVEPAVIEELRRWAGTSGVRLTGGGIGGLAATGRGEKGARLWVVR